jgi:hypothetical protein
MTDHPAVVRIAVVSDPLLNGRKALNALISSVLVDLLGAWLLMLGFMAAHNDWNALPTPGYWNCFLLLLGLGAAGIGLRGTVRVVRS